MYSAKTGICLNKRCFVCSELNIYSLLMTFPFVAEGIGLLNHLAVLQPILWAVLRTCMGRQAQPCK